MDINWDPLFLSLQLALVTAVILFLIAVPLAYWLAHSKFKGKFIVEALVSMPLVLPPTVLGFYLLQLIGKNGPIGSFFLENFDVQLAFTFPGLVIGSVIYSLPFMVQPIQNGFQGLSPSLRDASYTLGKSRFQTLMRVLLPNIKPALLTGIVLSFAHTIGEFGVVMMIGGAIPGTKVASIEIYQLNTNHDYGAAHVYSIVLFVTSFIILMSVYYFNKKMVKTLS